MSKYLLLNILKSNLSTEAYNWFDNQFTLVSCDHDAALIMDCFSKIPTHVLNENLKVSKEQEKILYCIIPGLKLNHWTTDRLVRVVIHYCLKHRANITSKPFNCFCLPVIWVGKKG